MCHRCSSTSGLQDAASQQQRRNDDAVAPVNHGIQPRDSASSAAADKQVEDPHPQQGDPNVFRGDSASYTERGPLRDAVGAAAAPPPATSRILAALRPATPPTAECSDRSFATALTDSSIGSITSSGSGGSGSGSGTDAGEDIGGDGSGTHQEDSRPESPRIRAIDAFVRHRSFTESDLVGDLCPLRANSAGAPSRSSISLDAWLRSGSGSLGGRAAPGRSSLILDNWLRAGSASSLDLPRGNPSGGGRPPKTHSSLSCDLRRGSGGLDGNAFAHRSTPGRLDSVRSSLGGKPPTRFSTDGRCSVDVERRRELLAASAAPLHLFESKLPHQVCHCQYLHPSVWPPLIMTWHMGRQLRAAGRHDVRPSLTADIGMP